MKALNADPDFSQQVLEELYRPRAKHLPVAVALAVVFGLFGFHRFYLGKTLTGALMLLTAGGGILWWLIDLVRIKKIVSQYNLKQQQRLEAGQPPQGLAFLPPKRAMLTNELPHWFARRCSKSRVYGSFFLLTLIGFVLGVISGSTGTYEPTVILMIFITVSLTAARFRLARKIPVIASLTRWVHKLRLYYYHVDPGNIWLLGLRPIYGVFIAPFRPKAWAEVRLYLELGIVFALLFFVSDMMEIAQHDSIWEGLSLMLAEFLQTLIFTYLFVAPVGALLTTQILLSRKDWVIWLLSIACITGVFIGLNLTGGI